MSGLVRLVQAPSGPVGGAARKGEGSPGKKGLLLELRRELKGRKRREIPEEARKLMEEYVRLKERLREIRRILRDEYGLFVTGQPVRLGHGHYDYRGLPVFKTVVAILREKRELTVRELEAELRRRGYSGITGTVKICLQNLREDGVLEKSGSLLVYRGD